MTLRRRDVLKAGAAASVVGGIGSTLVSCVEREERLYEQVVGRENDRSGVTRWRRGVCGQCDAGCTTQVRVVDGDAKKLEGVPEHPLTGGGLCALGQSALQELYDPDRLQQPLIRAGDRRETALQQTSWEQAMERVSAALHSSSSTRRVAVLSRVHDSLENRLLSALARSVQGEHFVYEPVWRAAERAAARNVFGWNDVPSYDLERADLVVSFGAPLLDRWRNPVWAASALRGEQRGVRGRRPTLVQVQPRFGLSEASADLWLAPRLGTEGLFAEALARVLAAAGGGASAQGDALVDDVPAGEDEAEVKQQLRAASATCDVPYAKVAQLVEWLRSARRPVVVAGGAWVNGLAPEASGGPSGLAAVEAALQLNQVLDRVGQPGGVFPPLSSPLRVPFDAPGPDALRAPQGFGAFLGRLRAAEVETLLLVDVDEALRGSEAEGLRELLASVDQVVGLTSQQGEVSAVSDVVLPTHSALERWHLSVAEVAAPGAVVVAAKPVVRALGSTLHPADIALSLGKAVASEVEASGAPWSADGAASLFEQSAAATAIVAGQRANEMLDRGHLEFAFMAEHLRDADPRPASLRGEADFADRSGLESSDLPLEISSAGDQAQGDGAAQVGGEFVLLPYETVHLADGRGANRAWLQQLPDPLSTVMWGSWAELSPQDLRRMGWRTGDWVQIVAADAAYDGNEQLVAVVENPAARPGTVALPAGYGQLGGGRYAQDRGCNVLALGGLPVPGLARFSTAGLRVRLRPAPPGEDRARLALFGRGLRHAEDLPTRRGRAQVGTVALSTPSGRGAPGAQKADSASGAPMSQEHEQGQPEAKR